MMTLTKLPEYKDHLVGCLVKMFLDELTHISSMHSNSVLTQTDAKSIANLVVDTVMDESTKTIPTLLNRAVTRLSFFLFSVSTLITFAFFMISLPIPTRLFDCFFYSKKVANIC